MLATKKPPTDVFKKKVRHVRKRTKNQGPRNTPKGMFAQEMTEERIAKLKEKKERNKTRESRIKAMTFEEWYDTLKDLLKKHKKHRLSSLELLLEKVENDHQLRRAIVIFQKFQEYAITVEDRAANLFLEKLSQFNRHTTAFRYLSDYHFFRLFPDFQHCYQLLIHFYIRKHFEHANRLSSVLRKRFGDDERLILADIKGKAQNGSIKEAYDNLLEARNRGLTIPESYYQTFLRAAIKGKPEVFDFFFTVNPLPNQTETESQILSKFSAVKSIMTGEASAALEECKKTGIEWPKLADELIRLGKRVATPEFDENLVKFFEAAEAEDHPLSDQQKEFLYSSPSPKKSPNNEVTA